METLSLKKFQKMFLLQKIKVLFSLSQKIEVLWVEAFNPPLSELQTWYQYLEWGAQDWPASVAKLLSQPLSFYLEREHFLWSIVPLEREVFHEPYFHELEVQSKDPALEKFEDSLIEIHSSTKNSTPLPLILVLENIRSSYNVGSIIRSAAFFGSFDIWGCGYTPSPWVHSKINKTSLISPSFINWQSFDSLDDVFQQLINQEAVPLAFETTRLSRSLSSWHPEVYKSSRQALFFGNERFGLSYGVLKRCESCFQISPQSGGLKNSLNVSTAVAIALYHYSSLWK